ncbi:unnamed protein product [Ranitomeya imitator]|uniref:Ig-like domain-containing protein n=1 Tax=Ranitomeya imitator TaxID=111125 RepID=A0ABN9LT95_9NEOB|nr:unnamed protein product [Ranitomeya imitator]
MEFAVTSPDMEPAQDPWKGKKASKATLARWITDAISLSYSSSGMSVPVEVKAHSTRAVAASWAEKAGASIDQICFLSLVGGSPLSVVPSWAQRNTVIGWGKRGLVNLFFLPAGSSGTQRVYLRAVSSVTITDKKVVLNAKSVLRCSATGFFPPDIDIKWIRDGKQLEDNISIGDPWRNPNRTYSVNSTVTITPTEEDREQNFSCRVHHKSLQEPLQEDFHLVYEDRSSAWIMAVCYVPVVILIIIIAVVLWWRLIWRKAPLIICDIVGPPKLIDGEEAVLCCTVDDAPEDLCVTWLIRRAGQEQEIQTSQRRERAEEEESLLDTSYVIKSQVVGRQYSSSLSFIPHMERHKGVTFICRGVSGKHKGERTFSCEMIYVKPKMSQPIKRSLSDCREMKYLLTLEKFYPKSINIIWTSPLIICDIVRPPKLIDGEEAVLCCTVDDAPEDLCTTWLIRRAGQEQEIQTSQRRERSEEAESLLDTSYVIKSQVVGHQYSSSLSFIPHMERHKDVTFICRGVSGKRKGERTFSCETIYVKPKMSQPIIRSLSDCREMKYLLNLEKCYPKSINIIWTCGEGRTQKVILSTDSISENIDRTYSISSEIVIPEDQHKDPGFRVRVTWEHDSMKKPEYRQLNIRDSDYIWTPVVEDIQIPRLLLGSPAVLQCNISVYFPDAVTVKWKRRDGDQLHEETDDNQRITSRRATDNTYSCTASLTITPDLQTHQGAEYICLVEHPSLETPIERRTGPLQIYGKPQMSAPIEITMADSSHVQFSLKLQKFYPKDIKISWRWENAFDNYMKRPDVKTISSQNDDLTYEVTSIIRIPNSLFKNPEKKFIVEWNHESMETSETRSLSVRDVKKQNGEKAVKKALTRGSKNNEVDETGQESTEDAGAEPQGENPDS